MGLSDYGCHPGTLRLIRDSSVPEKIESRRREEREVEPFKTNDSSSLRVLAS